MKKINKAAARTMDQLTVGLALGEARTIDNANGTNMAAHVERIGEKRYSVAHYFEQCGDLMADPDVVFYKAQDGWWYPCQVTMHATGYFRDFVEFDEDGSPTRHNRRGQADLATFCGTWMKNIKAQQGDLTPPPVTPEEPAGVPAPAGPMQQLAFF